MADAELPLRLLRFEDFEVDLRTGELRKAGVKLRFGGQPFQLLAILLERPGDICTREELQKRLWPDTFVDVDHNLNTAINKIREVLGDSAETPRFVETMPRRGYRFIGELERPNQAGVPVEPIRESSSRRMWLKIAAGVLTMLVLSVGAGVAYRWFWHGRPSEFLWLIRERLFGRQQITELQITRNSNDNPVMNAAISGDGKYLAFSDSHGIHIQLMATGEMRDIAQPAEFHDALVTWRIHWLPDSTRFLADSVPIGMPPTIWQASVVGGALRKVREDALAMSVSPDGAAVAFTKAWLRELWLMGINGDAPQKLDDAGDHGNYRNVVWSPDGNRLLYIRNDRSGSDLRISLETRDLKGGRPITLLTDRRIRSVYWLPDGRILYALGEPGLSGDTCNFWDARVDHKTGQFAAKPSQLTHSAGFCMASISATSDGKQLVFLRRSDEYSVYVADLAPDATRIAPPKHLTMTEGQEFPTAWTADSQEVILVSNRNGTWGFYRQGLNGDPAIPIITGIDSTGIVGGTIPRMSPDGKWLIYPHFPKNYEYGVNADVLRVPITGGTPQFILRDYIADTVRCAQAPATICAIATGPDEKHLVFTSFDPMLGRGHELARFEIDPELNYTWAISPDATRIAILKQSTGELHVLSINTHADHKIAVQHWNNLQSLDWTADGKGLFTSSMQPSGVLLHVDLQGHANILWEPKGTQMPWAIPSPDGRHVAMPGYAQNSNAWMMQNF